MPSWRLFSYWEGSDVFIVGGGPSIRTFPVSRLRGKRVIGCNDAYTFGDVITVLHFGDVKWYQKHKERLQKFQNIVIHTNEELKSEPFIYHAPRVWEGWHKDALGWNGNTGCSAINLALIMGARRIYLLGFDMKLGEAGESNWHVNELDTVTLDHYQRYRDGFHRCLRDWKANWPKVEIINLNPDSALEHFPKQSWEEVLGE